MKNLVESYNVDADKVAAQVRIWGIKGESVPLYEIKMPVFGRGTEAVISELVEELNSKVPLNVEEATDPEKLEKMKKEFFGRIKENVSKKMPEVKEAENNKISDR